MIRVFIIENHAAVIVPGLKNLFRTGRDPVHITGEAINVPIAVKEADPSSFDLIILDLWIPDAEPLENLKMLRANFPDKPVVIYTGETKPSWKRRMIAAGAMAYLTKDAVKDEIKTALFKAMAGEIYIMGMKPDEENQTFRGISEPDTDGLTPVQVDILLMLKTGLNHKQIAERMHTNSTKIERAIKTLRNKFHCKNNIELIGKLTDAGMI